MPLTPTQQAALGLLPRFYGYREVLEQVFAGDEAAFVHAWTTDALPLPVCQAVADSVTSIQIHTWWLRRISQQLEEARQQNAQLRAAGFEFSGAAATKGPHA